MANAADENKLGPDGQCDVFNSVLCGYAIDFLHEPVGGLAHIAGAGESLDTDHQYSRIAMSKCQVLRISITSKSLVSAGGKAW
jgi:hypothetical protein